MQKISFLMMRLICCKHLLKREMCFKDADTIANSTAVSLKEFWSGSPLFVWKLRKIMVNVVRKQYPVFSVFSYLCILKAVLVF